MAHVRPTIGGFHVALDQDETTRVRKSGAHLLVEVVQGSPSVSPIFDTEGEAGAFLIGFDAGVRATDEALSAACERYKLVGDEWVHLDELPDLSAAAGLRVPADAH
jgi:hypothetical protein